MRPTIFSRRPSALGELLLVGERRGAGTVLTGCYLPDHRRGPAVDPSWVEDDAAFASIASAIDAHLAGDATATADLRVAFRGGTPFQRRTWEALRRVPAGSTVTYGELAAHLGAPRAARAVGAAVARNPVSVVVPCHRVVGAGGSLSGYAGGLAAKRRLLAIEGAAVAR
jgi:methylated-DNA-[protein]-cysteine S-methyltransferase